MFDFSVVVFIRLCFTPNAIDPCTTYGSFFTISQYEENKKEKSHIDRKIYTSVILIVNETSHIENRCH